MSEGVSFKSGKDIGEEPVIDDDARLTCSEYGAMTTAQAAYESGWQLAPLVCPRCRRRPSLPSTRAATWSGRRRAMLKVERYRDTRFWGLYEAGVLLCVTVCKKGAEAVKTRIERGKAVEKRPESKAVPTRRTARGRLV